MANVIVTKELLKLLDETYHSINVKTLKTLQYFFDQFEKHGEQTKSLRRNEMHELLKNKKIFMKEDKIYQNKLLELKKNTEKIEEEKKNLTIKLNEMNKEHEENKKKHENMIENTKKDKERMEQEKKRMEQEKKRMEQFKNNLEKEKIKNENDIENLNQQKKKSLEEKNNLKSKLELANKNFKSIMEEMKNKDNHTNQKNENIKKKYLELVNELEKMQKQKEEKLNNINAEMQKQREDLEKIKKKEQYEKKQNENLNKRLEELEEQIKNQKENITKKDTDVEELNKKNQEESIKQQELIKNLEKKMEEQKKKMEEQKKEMEEQKEEMEEQKEEMETNTNIGEMKMEKKTVEIKNESKEEKMSDEQLIKLPEIPSEIEGDYSDITEEEQKIIGEEWKDSTQRNLQKAYLKLKQIVLTNYIFAAIMGNDANYQEIVVHTFIKLNEDDKSIIEKRFVNMSEINKYIKEDKIFLLTLLKKLVSATKEIGGKYVIFKNKEWDGEKQRENFIKLWEKIIAKIIIIIKIYEEKKGIENHRRIAEEIMNKWNNQLRTQEDKFINVSIKIRKDENIYEEHPRIQQNEDGYILKINYNDSPEKLSEKESENKATYIFNSKQIFGPTIKGSDASRKIFKFPKDKSSNHCLIGYGQSGAGKTGFLLSYANNDGVLLQLLKDQEEKENGLQDLKISIIEVYNKTAAEYMKKNKFFEKKLEKIFCGDEESNCCRIIYPEEVINKYYEIEKGKTACEKDNEFTGETTAKDTAKDIFAHFTDGKLSINEKINTNDYILISLLCRFIEPTANNRESSRSHLIICLNFTDENGKERTIFVIDAAGVENELNCDRNSDEFKQWIELAKTQCYGEEKYLHPGQKFTNNNVECKPNGEPKINVEQMKKNDKDKKEFIVKFILNLFSETKEMKNLRKKGKLSDILEWTRDNNGNYYFSKYELNINKDNIKKKYKRIFKIHNKKIEGALKEEGETKDEINDEEYKQIPDDVTPEYVRKLLKIFLKKNNEVNNEVHTFLNTYLNNKGIVIPKIVYLYLRDNTVNMRLLLEYVYLNNSGNVDGDLFNKITVEPDQKIKDGQNRLVEHLRPTSQEPSNHWIKDIKNKKNTFLTQLIKFIVSFLNEKFHLNIEGTEYNKLVENIKFYDDLHSSNYVYRDFKDFKEKDNVWSRWIGTYPKEEEKKKIISELCNISWPKKINFEDIHREYEEDCEEKNKEMAEELCKIGRNTEGKFINNSLKNFSLDLKYLNKYNKLIKNPNILYGDYINPKRKYLHHTAYEDWCKNSVDKHNFGIILQGMLYLKNQLNKTKTDSYKFIGDMKTILNNTDNEGINIDFNLINVLNFSQYKRENGVKIVMKSDEGTGETKEYIEINNPPKIPYINIYDLEYVLKEENINKNEDKLEYEYLKILSKISKYNYYNDDFYKWDKMNNGSIMFKKLNLIVNNININNAATLIGTIDTVDRMMRVTFGTLEYIPSNNAKKEEKAKKEDLKNIIKKKKESIEEEKAEKAQKKEEKEAEKAQKKAEKEKLEKWSFPLLKDKTNRNIYTKFFLDRLKLLSEKAPKGTHHALNGAIVDILIKKYIGTRYQNAKKSLINVLKKNSKLREDMEKNNTFTYENHDDIIKKIDDYILKKKPFNKNSQGAPAFYEEYYKDKLQFTPTEIKEMLCKMNEVDDVCEDKQVKKKPLKTIRQRPPNVEGFTRTHSTKGRKQGLPFGRTRQRRYNQNAHRKRVAGVYVRSGSGKMSDSFGKKGGEKRKTKKKKRKTKRKTKKK